jgi:hypothetical protein
MVGSIYTLPTTPFITDANTHILFSTMDIITLSARYPTYPTHLVLVYHPTMAPPVIRAAL